MELFVSCIKESTSRILLHNGDKNVTQVTKMITALLENAVFYRSYDYFKKVGDVRDEDKDGAT